MDLERILHAQGFGSRRQCRGLIEAGRVQIAGTSVTDAHADFDTANLAFTVDDVSWQYHDRVYLAMHKPAGVECSRTPQHHGSVFDLLPRPFVERGVQCVGRLDQDTTGLLLLSDDGQFIHACTAPRRKVPKVYCVWTCEPLSDAQVAALDAGVMLHGETQPTVPLHVARTGPDALRLTLAEGKYHQVKRMLGALGHRVRALHRDAIGTLALPPTLAPGSWTWLDAAQREQVLTARPVAGGGTPNA